MKGRCQYKCRLVPITERLWMCEHTEAGSAAWSPDAVAAGRLMLERAGGYDAVLARVVDAEEARRRQKAGR